MSVTREHSPYVDHDTDKGVITIHATDHLPLAMSTAVAEEIADALKRHAEEMRAAARLAYAKEYR